MLTFQSIETTATPEFAQAWQCYEEAFPEEERRALVQQKEVLQNKRYCFQRIIQEQDLVGVIGFWELENFLFLEHFAIDKGKRGQGLGQETLQLFKQATDSPIVLEVEPPSPTTTTTAHRRISFYQHLGFALNPFPYQQPPYGIGKPWVPLQLMSFPAPLTLKEFTQVQAQLYDSVYKIKVP